MDQCEICGRSAEVKLRSSGFAPVSFTSCEQCTKQAAEPLQVVLTWLYHEGGVAISPSHKERLISHSDGTYIGWNDIAHLYIVNEHRIAAEMDADVDLIDEEDNTP